MRFHRGINGLRWFIVLVAIGISARSIGSGFSNNIGTALFYKSLQNKNIYRYFGDDTIGGTLIYDLSARNSINWLEYAANLEKSSTVLLSLGRAQMAAGDFENAGKNLRTVIEKGSKSKAVFGDTLLALSLSGQYNDVVELYEKYPIPLETVTVSDTVALAYLEKAQPFIERGDVTQAAPILKMVLNLRPSDLFANSQLYLQTTNNEAQDVQDIHEKSRYYERIKFFTGAALRPTDERLVGYAVRAIPILLENGIWERDTFIKVASELIWHQTDAVDLEPLLYSFLNESPGDINVLLLIAELNYRRGQHNEAMKLYKQILEIDPDYADVYLWLGLLCNKVDTNCSEREMLSRYISYLNIHPHDLFAHKQIMNMCLSKETSEIPVDDCQRAAEIIVDAQGGTTPSTQILLQEYQRKLDNREYIAELLGVSMTDIAYGPNLWNNGNFETFTNIGIGGWKLSDEISHGTSFRNNAFLGGTDDLLAWEGTSSFGLMGLWTGKERNAPGWYGIYPWDDEKYSSIDMTPLPQQWYLLNVYFRTNSDTAEAYVHLNGNAIFKLPPTNGEWRLYQALYCNSSENQIIAPFLFLSNPDDRAWFDDVSFRQLVVSQPVSSRCDVLSNLQQDSGE